MIVCDVFNIGKTSLVCCCTAHAPSKDGPSLQGGVSNFITFLNLIGGDAPRTCGCSFWHTHRPWSAEVQRQVEEPDSKDARK